MIKFNLNSFEDNSSHTFEFNTLEEVKETYSLTDKEFFDFFRGFRVNPKDADYILHLIHKD